MNIVVIDKPRSVYENLSINDACLEAVCNGDYERIVRVYRFSRPGVILSEFEDIWDVHEHARNKIDITRRPTGGSAVYVNEATIGYSVFLKTKNKTDVTHLYKEFTGRVLNALKSFSITEVKMNGWYVRVDGGVVAGHAQQHRGSASEFQGLIILTRWNMEAIDSVIRLRKLAEWQGNHYLIIDGAAYDLQGNQASVLFDQLRVVRDEYSELAKAPSLADYGITASALMEKLAGHLSGLKERHVLPEKIQNRAVEIEQKYKNANWVFNPGKKTRRGLGHCFVDLVEREPELERIT